MENDELRILKGELEAWRSRKDRGRTIPEGIWQRASVLARVVGVTKVHQELKLGFQDLKRRMGDGKEPVRKAVASFVALPFESSRRVENCTLKIESVSGARLQAEFSDIEPAALSQILREFAAG